MSPGWEIGIAFIILLILGGTIAALILSINASKQDVNGSVLVLQNSSYVAIATGTSILIPDTILTNYGGFNYDTSSGVITVSNGGIYSIQSGLTLESGGANAATGSTFATWFSVNNSSLQQGLSEATYPEKSTAGGATVPLAAGDQISFFVDLVGPAIEYIPPMMSNYALVLLNKNMGGSGATGS